LPGGNCSGETSADDFYLERHGLAIRKVSSTTLRTEACSL
jgi:hypothetical protein